MLKAVFKLVFIPIILLIAGATIATYFLISTGKEMNADANWFDSETGLDQKVYIELGGVQQHLRIRSRDKENPVLLVLHGGPGAPMMGMAHRALSPLTEYFTVVEWDQHGSGLSEGYDSKDLSYQQVVNEAIELVEHLRSRFGVKKIVIVGHSWGSLLGLGVIQQRPDLFYAYVGVGQALAWNKGFDETRRLVLDAARKAGDKQTIARLTSLPSQWPPSEDTDAVLSHINAIQLGLIAYKGSVFASRSNDLMKTNTVLDIALSPDINVLDGLGLLNISPATKSLFSNIYDKDLRTELGYHFEVPMFIFQGKHDWQTPTSLVKPWFEKISTSYKRYVSFEDSAHMVFTEEPGKYLIEMVTLVRPFALDDSN